MKVLGLSFFVIWFVERRRGWRGRIDCGLNGAQRIIYFLADFCDFSFY